MLFLWTCLKCSHDSGLFDLRHTTRHTTTIYTMVLRLCVGLQSSIWLWYEIVKLLSSIFLIADKMMVFDVKKNSARGSTSYLRSVSRMVLYLLLFIFVALVSIPLLKINCSYVWIHVKVFQNLPLHLSQTGFCFFQVTIKMIFASTKQASSVPSMRTYGHTPCPGIRQHHIPLLYCAVSS